MDFIYLFTIILTGKYVFHNSFPISNQVQYCFFTLLYNAIFVCVFMNVTLHNFNILRNERERKYFRYDSPEKCVIQGCISISFFYKQNWLFEHISTIHHSLDLFCHRSIFLEKTSLWARTFKILPQMLKFTELRCYFSTICIHFVSEISFPEILHFSTIADEFPWKFFHYNC